MAIFERSQLKIDSNSNFSFGFDALQINFFALNDSSSKVSAVSPIKETDIVGADSILQKVFPDNPEWTRINHTFDLYLHPVDWDEYRCSTKEGPAPFLNLQTRSWDGLNFRVGMDFISDIKFDCKPVLSFSPINFASQKLKDGTYMYSTNYLFWLPVAISMLSNYTFEYFPPDKPDWPTILLFIWDMPNFLFNGQIEFPFKSGCEYWAGVFGLKTDWYAWGEGEYGTLCWEPRIGIKYIHNKNIGFQINCVFPFWGDDVYNRDIYHVDLKFPYIGIDLLLYLSQDYANEIIR